MEEYTVIKIVCKKETKAYDIYAAVKSTLKFNRNLFEFCGLFKHEDKVSSKKKQKLEALNLQRFYYVKVLEHLRKNPYYDPEKNDIRLFSNLDSSWDWNNKENTDSLDNTVFEELIKFADELKMLDASTILLGIDEIEWDGNKVGHGTYGYEKAKSTHHGGENYLSNSIIISKAPYEHKPYTVYLSCEKRFRKLESIKTIIKAIGGKIKYEQTYFAPENKEERRQWEQTYIEAQKRFATMISGLKEVLCNVPERIEDHRLDWTKGVNLNIRKNLKKVLCNDGWEIVKNLPSWVGTRVSKSKGNATVSIIIDSLHGGQYLQTLISYYSTQFEFSENTNYIYTLLSEEEVCKYLKNIKYIADYVYDAL